MAQESKNEDRKQRIREAFHDGKQVERMPAREDMAPQHSDDVIYRVAPYCRVSTMSEMQAESFEIQQQYYNEYIAKHPNWTLVRIYADEGISATSVKNRKDFNNMIEDCKAGKIDLIVTKSVSRFARNVVDCIKYARDLRALSPPVGIYFETENINTLSQNGELLLTVLAAFAQDESVNKSISVAWGIRQRFAKGIPKLVKPYGYQNDDGKLVVDEEEASVVIRIFAFYLGGKTPYEIAKILTDEGVPTPTGKKPCWTLSSVTYILGNDRYCGDVIMQKSLCVDLFAHKRVRNLGQVERYRMRDVHPPLISKEEWREAKNRISMPDREAVILEEITGEGILSSLHPILFKEDIGCMNACMSEFRIVNPTLRTFSAAEARIAHSSIRFNNLSAAELGYPEHIRLLISSDGCTLAIQACDPKDKCAVPFMAGRTADDLKGQKKWTTVSNRMLTHIIRSKLGWETAKTPRRFYGVPWPEQGAIIFDLTKIAPPRTRTPNLSAEDMLRAYELAESGSLLPVMAPAWSRQPFASVPPSEVIETQYVQVS